MQDMKIEKGAWPSYSPLVDFLNALPANAPVYLPPSIASLPSDFKPSPNTLNHPARIC